MRKRVILSAATILLGAVVLLFLLVPQSSQAITKEQATKTVISLYGGKPEKTTARQYKYEVEFQRDKGLYLAQVNRESGQVESVELIEKAQTVETFTQQQIEKIALERVPGSIENIEYNEKKDEYAVHIKDDKQLSIVVLSAKSGKVSSINQEPVATDEGIEQSEPDRIITRNEAIKRAKKILEGEVQDVDFEETEDGGYYLVEIENEETDQEATIQIHAVRGNTMTVEWDN